MRADALGFFWEDTPAQKIRKTKEKREPPEPVWLAPDYLPGYEEAVRFPIHLMTDAEIIAAQRAGEVLVFDVESYWNYFCVSFRSVVTGHAIVFELVQGIPLDLPKLHWVTHNFTIVGFNSRFYDMPMLALALANTPVHLLKYATDLLITSNMRTYEVLKEFKVKELKEVDHVDLIEVAPLRANLKVYGGRLHTPKMQDLPFPPNAKLSPEQIACVRWYNVNADLVATATLYNALQDQLRLRESMSHESFDLRSRSDAQIAEAVIGRQLFKITHKRPRKTYIEPGTSYKYRPPHWLRYRTPLMQSVLGRICAANFEVADHGSIVMPPRLKDFAVPIANGIYRMGLGGLHSSETTVAHYSDDEYVLIDKDVTSYYPAIILNLSLFPKHLGPAFLRVYRSIVQTRVEAKRRGDKVTADTLKITVNGSFGKFGNKYSILYSPDLLFQVTVTGQLALLLLIEAIELAGIEVVSANTDGIVIKCPRARVEDLNAIVLEWERDTGFQTEGTTYKALFSRDVNNYLALKEDNTFKAKGAYVNPQNPTAALYKNPANTICLDAVEAYLLDKTPLAQTIQECRNITRFVTVRTVRGGAVKVWPNGKLDYLGKSIRWYYARGQEDSEIVYAKSGNRVPRSDGAMPLMELPTCFPDDVDYDWYEEEAAKILREIGVDY